MQKKKTAIFLMVCAAASLLTSIARQFRDVVVAQGKGATALSGSSVENKLAVNVRPEILGNAEDCFMDQLISPGENAETKFVGCGGFI